MRNLLFTTAVALCAAIAPAQFATTLTGRIVAAPASPCNASATHMVECTDVLLTSSTVDLGSLVGQTVDLQGNLVPALGCVTLDVTSAAPATARTRLTALQGTRLNRPIIVTTTAPAGSSVFYVFSGGSGFVPLGPFGSLLVDFTTAQVRGPDISIGIALHTWTIPDDPTLVGVNIWIQTAMVAILPAPEGRLLNAICFTIQA
jgi:hypothetical protein